MLALSAEAEAFFSDVSAELAPQTFDSSHLPRHISIIMDGNGRWATQQGLARTDGHKAGVKALKEIITTAVHLRIQVLSAYAFSTENWKRPQKEVDFLMNLFAKTLVQELPLFAERNVKLAILGDLESLPTKTADTFKYGLQETASHTGMVLALCVNYGGRAEIVRSARILAQAVAYGELSPQDISEEQFAATLYTAGLPDPELIIRTSGEMRLSNYLLYQSAYAELYCTPVLWPDFNKQCLLEAIRAYQGRQRRFGGLTGEGGAYV